MGDRVNGGRRLQVPGQGVIRHSHLPGQAAAQVAVPIPQPDGIHFVSTGGFTKLEEAALRIAPQLVCNPPYDEEAAGMVAMSAVQIARAVLECCAVQKNCEFQVAQPAG